MTAAGTVIFLNAVYIIGILFLLLRTNRKIIPKKHEHTK